MEQINPLIKKIQRIAMYLFFFFLNFEYWDPFNTLEYFTLAKLAGFLYLLTLIPQINYFTRTDAIKRFLRPAWLFFLLLTVVNLLNVNSISSNFFNMSIFSDIIIFWFLINHERRERLVLEKGFLSFAFGTIAFSLLFYAGIGVTYLGGRVSVFGDNENVIGIRSGIAILILILVVVQNRLGLGRLRYLLIIPIPIIFKLLAETGSRVAFISVALAFVLDIMLIKTKWIWQKIIVLVVGVVISLYSWQFILQSETLYNRLFSASEDSLGDRYEIWHRILPLIYNNPILGVGETGYLNYSQETFNKVESPHNVILEVLCYTGIIGLIIYSVFLFRIFKTGYQTYRSDGFLLPLTLIIFVCGMILSGQILDYKLAWVIFAYIVGCSFFKKKSTLI